MKRENILMVNKNMKKFALSIVILTLFLAGLACNLPSQATPAEVSVEIAIPDGFKVEGRVVDDRLISLSLPESYFVSTAAPDFSALLGSLGDSGVAVGSDLENLLGNAQEDILIWGYESDGSGSIPVSFVVLKNEDYAAVPLGLLSTFVGPLLGNRVQILAEHRLTIAGRDTLRWVTLTNESGIEFSQVVYVFKDSGTLYLVGFNVEGQSVDRQVGVFDAIIASLTIEDLE